MPNSEILPPPYDVPDKRSFKVKSSIMLWNESQEFLYSFCFQFEEQILERPEDLEKLRNGKTMCSNCSDEGTYKVNS